MTSSNTFSTIKLVYDLVNTVLLFCAAQMADSTVRAYPDPYVVDYTFAVFTLVAVYLSIALVVVLIVFLCTTWARDS